MPLKVDTIRILLKNTHTHTKGEREMKSFTTELHGWFCVIFIIQMACFVMRLDISLITIIAFYVKLLNF